MKEENYQKLFGLDQRPAPEKLYKAVLLRIGLEKKRDEKRRFIVAGFSLTASIFAVVPAVLSLANSLAASGFWKFVSLLFSDGSLVLTYWKEFSLTLLESFSVPEMILTLVCVFAIALSVKFLFKNKSAFSVNTQFNYI